MIQECLVLLKAFATKCCWAFCLSVFRNHAGMYLLWPFATCFHYSQTKKPPPLVRRRPCARDWIRTSTPFPAPPPQGGASTNFATRAFGCAILRVNVQSLTFLFSLSGQIYLF